MTFRTFTKISFQNLCLLITWIVLCCGEGTAQNSDPESDSVDKDYAAELPRLMPLSPEQALLEFEVLPGFEVHLVACEPLVTDPVAFAFDAKGRLWVVEMRDYSEQDTERLGRIALLTDTNGDGQMDHRTTFVENLSWPTALWPWRDGVLVAEPPHLTWYRDLDGNGVADESEVWYSGFGRSNVQGLINSFRWGVDGWIHGVTSSSGASLQSRINDQSIELGRRDFAIDPITKLLRPETGGGQHGMSFNRWGDKFVTSNSDHLQQILEMEDWLASNVAAVPFPSLRRSIAEDGPQAEVFRASPVEPWRVVRTRLRISGVAPGMVEGGGRAAGYFTGATGTWIFDPKRGYGLPDSDTAVVCDVGSNLVHRKKLIDRGLFYSAQRIDEQTELLRSRDTWFRPVQIGDGPDGALYIADMYREVIEHPLSLPPMIKKHLDLTSGRDRGRIWKLTNPKTPSAKFEDLSQLDANGLVARLESEIAWQRLMASQLIVERHAQGSFTAESQGLLEQLLQQSVLKSPQPETRILCLWLLSRLNLPVPPALVREVLAESHPRVVASVLDVIRQELESNTSGMSKVEWEGLQTHLLELAQQCTDERVILSLARLAPRLDEQKRLKLLRRILPNAKEALVRATVATAASGRSWELLESNEAASLNQSEYVEWLSLLLPTWLSRVNEVPELAQFVLQSLHPESTRQTAWLTALSRIPSHSSISKLIQSLSVQSLVDSQIDQQLDQQLEQQSDQQSDQQSEQAGIQNTAGWLGLTSTGVQSKWMDRLMDGTVAEPIQTAAITALHWANHPDLPERLVSQFRSMTPSLQQVSLRALVARPERLQHLVTALESGQIARSQIPPEIRQNLTTIRDSELKERVERVLVQASPNREAVIQRFQQVLETNGLESADPSVGRTVFERSCAQCHRLGQVGQDVGPPLQQLGEKNPEQLLEAILDPNREVDPKYASYTILTDDGLVINGLILQESGNQILMAEPGGRQSTLDRSSIEQIQSAGLSLMPEGLEEQISPEQMLDLIQFLKSSDH